MVKTLVKRGNSYSLTMDQTILALMKADGSTTFELVMNGEELTVRPLRSPSKQARLNAISDEIIETQAEVFKKLAE